jgi:ribosomal protein S18 acetylase RimI-like enzyme
MSLDIRIASRNDAERVAQLAKDTFVATFTGDNTRENLSAYVESAFSLEVIGAELADPASIYMWAEESGIPAGYAKLRRGEAAECITGLKPVELQRIYAMSDQIGVGVGKSLLNMCIKLAKAEGFQTLWLGVWERNARAIEFYSRQGFIDVGSHGFMLGTERQTDLLMQLDLRR